MDVMQKPAQGIMETSYNIENTKSFTVNCECTQQDHQIDTWIEVNKELEVKQISVTFYVKTYIPFINNILNRIKVSWNILIYGTYQQQHELLMRDKVALNFAHAILNSVDELSINIDKQKK